MQIVTQTLFPYKPRVGAPVRSIMGSLGLIYPSSAVGLSHSLYVKGYDTFCTDTTDYFLLKQTIQNAIHRK